MKKYSILICGMLLMATSAMAQEKSGSERQKAPGNEQKETEVKENSTGERQKNNSNKPVEQPAKEEKPANAERRKNPEQQ